MTNQGALRVSHDGDSIEPGRIVAEAKIRLLEEPHLSVQRIWCEYDGQQLFLRGQVPSFYHKQLAQVAVAGLDGVDRVVNEIEVLW
jgi:osmotically-inducible protein OsmY